MFSKVLIAERAEVADQGILVNVPRPPLEAEGSREPALVAAVAAAIVEHNRRVRVVDLAEPCGDHGAVTSWRHAALFGVS